MAVAKAAANVVDAPLYRYIGGPKAQVLPVPLMNIVNGGVHADNPIDFQEFMIMPVGGGTFRNALRMGAEIFHTLKKALHDAGHNTNVGDEGGFAPNLKSADEALAFVVRAIEKAGYKPGDDVMLALRSSLDRVLQGRKIYFGRRGPHTRSCRHGENLRRALPPRYPIVSIEDGMAEDDWDGWRRNLPGPSARRCNWWATIFFVTNVKRLNEGIKKGTANAILVKVNQIGTLSETLDTVETAHRASYRVVMSHRSGETEDTTIADLAVATNCGQIKTGSLARSDRLAKYNQLLRIEEQLGDQAIYAGRSVLRGV